MSEYERYIFNGKCPYTDRICDNDTECEDCEVEQLERDFKEGK